MLPHYHASVRIFPETSPNFPDASMSVAVVDRALWALYRGSTITAVP